MAWKAGPRCFKRWDSKLQNEKGPEVARVIYQVLHSYAELYCSIIVVYIVTDLSCSYIMLYHIYIYYIYYIIYILYPSSINNYNSIRSPWDDGISASYTGTAPLRIAPLRHGKSWEIPQTWPRGTHSSGR